MFTTKGSKRFALSDSNPETNDSAFRSKRIMAESPLDAHRAGTSQPQSTSTPLLDIRRAESSRKHVRALNTQFASWVQAQLQSHPDELWEDGIRDYLSHASNIMEKFSDVVNWIKANTVRGECLTISGSHTTGNTMMPEIKSNEVKSFPEKTGCTPIGTTAGFATSRSFGALSNSQPPVFFGNTVPEVKSNSIKSVPEKTGATPGGATAGFATSWCFGGQTSVLAGNTTLPEFKSNEKKSIPEKTGCTPGATTSAFANSWSFGTPSNGQPSALVGNTSSEIKSNEMKSLPEKTGCSPFVTTAGFATSWSFGAPSNSQPPLSVGSGSTVTATGDASNDVDGEADLEQPSSPSVKRIEEKGIIVVHEVKCKLYVKSSDPADKDAWKDRGMGNLSIKCNEDASKGTKESKPTIVVRNDVGRLLLNALLYPGIKTNAQKNNLVAIFHTSVENGDSNESVVAQTFLIRLKTEEDQNKLATVIQDYAPVA